MKKQMYFETWTGEQKYFIRIMDNPVRVGTLAEYSRADRAAYFDRLDTLRQAHYIELHLS